MTEPPPDRERPQSAAAPYPIGALPQPPTARCRRDALRAAPNSPGPGRGREASWQTRPARGHLTRRRRLALEPPGPVRPTGRARRCGAPCRGPSGRPHSARPTRHCSVRARARPWCRRWLRASRTLLGVPTRYSARPRHPGGQSSSNTRCARHRRHPSRPRGTRSRAAGGIPSGGRRLRSCTKHEAQACGLAALAPGPSHLSSTSCPRNR